MEKIQNPDDELIQNLCDLYRSHDWKDVEVAMDIVDLLDRSTLTVRQVKKLANCLGRRKIRSWKPMEGKPVLQDKEYRERAKQISFSFYELHRLAVTESSRKYLEQLALKGFKNDNSSTESKR